MSIQSLVNIKNALNTSQTNEAKLINDFCNEHYKKEINHLIGYEPYSANISNYPLLCYIPAKKNYNSTLTREENQASIVIQIMEKGVTDGVKDGVLVADNLEKMLVNFLFKQPVKSLFLSNFSAITDLGLQHPFYEIEISFNYTKRA